MLSVVVVGMGVSLGREGAPKQAGAVIANAASDRGRLSDDERRLLVACGAGAGLAAAYGVPLGGALFALEVLRGELALRFVLPALLTSLIATGVAWLFLPDAPTYAIPAYAGSLGSAVWVLLAGPVAGLVAVLYVRAVAWADRHRPKGGPGVAAPVLALGLLGAVSIPFPQLLGNGRDVAELAFTGQVTPLLLLALLLLKPAATLLCLGSGAPGGLFTPSLALGALLGGVLGHPWSLLWPGRAAWPVRRARGRRRAGRDHPGSDLDRRPHGRADRTGTVLHPAPAPRGGGRHADGAPHRGSLDLRRTAQRRRGAGTPASARPDAQWENLGGVICRLLPPPGIRIVGAQDIAVSQPAHGQPPVDGDDGEPGTIASEK